MFTNSDQVAASTQVLGHATVAMLAQVHQDALWMLENLGIACTHPAMVELFSPLEADGKAIVFDNRIYITEGLVEACLAGVPGIDAFFVPRQSLFIGGRAPFIYDDAAGRGGVPPTLEHVARIAEIAEVSPIAAGMGAGVVLKDEAAQIQTMAARCTKPLLVPQGSPASLQAAKQLQAQGRRLMATFCLTRPPLQVNENAAPLFVEAARCGLPLFLAALPMAGISAPYCASGVLTVAHAEVLFALCTAQLFNPGSVCVHAGFPAIADPLCDYRPNYGLVSHNVLNLLMAHLNMMLDLPTIQSGATTNESDVTPRALADARTGLAIFKRYGFHMLRHAFGFLGGLLDFSIAKLAQVVEIAEAVTADEAPDIAMPVYDERGMASIQRYGLGMYKDDPLTAANIGKVFMD